ncbi:MAG: A24 family peptidase [Aeromicrobium sp.]|uniref:prepilin peptidase n=1 Tax=Aeromicrobium sp. TaxID=1871063 RepID=UPI0039E68239
MEIVGCAGAAALVGGFGPWVIGRLPEPEEPAEGKALYADIARPRWLAPFLAVFAGTLAGVVAWRVESAAVLPVWVAVCGVGAWLAYIDWRTRLLPYLVVAPLYLTVVALTVLGAWIADDWGIAVRAAVANIVVFAVFWLMHLIGRRLGQSFGYGDVRLATVLAVALGPFGATSTLVGLYAGFVIGAVAGIALSAARLTDKGTFAFGPYLILGAVVGACWPS